MRGASVVGCTVPSSPLLTNPTLRALVAIALFTYTAQNMLNVSIAPLSRALDLPEWIVGAAVSLAAAAVTWNVEPADLATVVLARIRRARR